MTTTTHKCVLKAWVFALLLGIVFSITSVAAIYVYTAPKTAVMGEWDDFSAAYRDGTVQSIRVYERQRFFQYQTVNQNWVNVSKTGHKLADYNGVSYPEKLRLMMSAAVIICSVFLAPIAAETCCKSNRATAKRPAQTVPNTTPSQAQKPATITAKPAKTTACTNAATPKTVEKSVKEKRTTFADIAGYDTTKQNMEFIVRCLSHPELLKSVGAKIPAGVLLYGPPGTGKTLMAKAIAGSAGVNFYNANASEFVNTWVGKGAENVRALYAAAKAHAPSIVFIDEIDAIGGQRSNDMNQEYRQTLNALLTEMDGLDKNSGVLTIAATNAFDSLDSALTRPGRFDRKIAVPLPNYNDRLAIAKLYAKSHRLEHDISMEKIARDTAGMAGSAIATLFNEAAIKTVMANRTAISETDMDAAMTQLLTNGENAVASNKEDLRVAAYHEAGHAVILRLLADEEVPKVSIVGTTSGAVGMTVHVDQNQRQLMPLSKLKKLIVAIYGGRAAEELILGKEEITTGARDDLSTASVWIRDYIRYGAGNSLLDEASFSGKSSTASMLQEAKKISDDLYQEALTFLNQHRKELEKVAEQLLLKDTIFEEELETILH